MSFALALLISVSGALGAEHFVVPPITDPVMDQAQMLSSSVIQALNQALRRLRDEGGSQIAVLTVTELSGLTIEQASIQVTDQWKLGTKDKDNGILLFISKNDRQMRIEVGQGHEGDLPDALAKRIINETIRPMFKGADYDNGVLLGVYEIVKLTDPKVDFEAYLGRQTARPHYGRAVGAVGLLGLLVTLFPGLIWILLVAFILVILRRPGGRGGGGWYGGGFGGGMGGGGFSGGGFSGGFGGGGGGFSGGGASGSW